MERSPRSYALNAEVLNSCSDKASTASKDKRICFRAARKRDPTARAWSARLPAALLPTSAPWFVMFTNPTEPKAPTSALLDPATTQLQARLATGGTPGVHR